MLSLGFGLIFLASKDLKVGETVNQINGKGAQTRTPPERQAKQPENVVEISLPNAEPGSFPVLNIFVQVACHIARGGKLGVIGKPFEKLRELRDFEPRITNEGKTISGNVIYIDNYGNVVTNIQKSAAGPPK